MKIHRGSLARVHGVRDVGAPIDVVVSDCVDQGDVREVPNALVSSQTAVNHVDAHVLGQGRGLFVGELHEEGGPVDNGPIVQLDTEEVVLGVGGKAGIHAGVQAALQVRDGRNGLVVDLDVVGLQVRLPVGEARFGGGAVFRGVCAVDEGHEVRLLGGDFADHGWDGVQGRDQTQRLVGVLIAIAPRALRSLVRRTYDVGGSQH